MCRTLISILSNEFQWSQIEPKAEMPKIQAKQSKNHKWMVISESNNYYHCFVDAANGFFEQCQGILEIVVDRSFPMWERCDTMRYFTTDCFPVHNRILVKRGANTNFAEIKTGNKLDETILLCYTNKNIFCLDHFCNLVVFSFGKSRTVKRTPHSRRSCIL